MHERTAEGPTVDGARSRTTIGILDAAVGISAIGGAAYALGSAPGWSTSWLEGSPFKTYRIPGLVLGFVHAPLDLAAAWFVLRRRPHATEVALASGAVQVGWIVIQARMIGMRSFLQPLLGAIGLVSLGLALGRLRAERASARAQSPDQPAGAASKIAPSSVAC